MAKKKKIAGRDTDVIAEYRLLNALVMNESLVDNPIITEDCFIHETAKSIYQAIAKLHNEGIKVTQASLLQAGYSIDCNVNGSIINEIYNVDPEGATELSDIMTALKTAKDKNRILWEIDKLKDSLEAEGSINVDSTLSKLYKIDDLVSKSGKSDSKLLNFSDWSDRYIEDLEQRKLGRKYSFGDPLLDKYLFKGASPGCITIICASTNMGKSTYVLSLIDNLLDQNVPCMYISLEMGTIDTMDRLMAKRLEIPNTELYKPENIDGIIEQVQEEKENLSNRKNFYFCEATGVDVDKLRSLIREFKQKTKKDYCLVAIDLLSGMKDFMVGNGNVSTASMIEINMNRLEELAKDENVHIMGVVQLNRQVESTKISHVEEIEKMRPGLSDLKNSGAYAEKSCQLLCCWRPAQIAHKYCRNDPATETMDDIMEVQILKDRNDQAGRILKYLFDGKHFKLIPLMEDDEAKLNKLKELNIDY